MLVGSAWWGAGTSAPPSRRNKTEWRKGTRECASSIRALRSAAGNQNARAAAWTYLCGMASQPIEEKVDDGRGKQGQHLTYDQSSDNGDTERPPQLGPGTSSKSERQPPEHRGHGGHHDWPEPQNARFVDCVARILALIAFGREREIDHQNRVLLHEPDEQNNSDQGNHRQ